jgi:hypothetical protein
MDAAQITGSASSYARKYALCGLFAIDDGVDPDLTNKHGKDTSAPQPTLQQAIAEVNKCTTTDAINSTYRNYPQFAQDKQFISACANRKNQLLNT